jgi:hypothetical protein
LECDSVKIGLREKIIEKGPGAADNPDIVVVYGKPMGLIEDIKALGWRILARWNKELYRVVCSSNTPEDQEIKSKILGALDISEAALIAAVVPALLWLGASAAIAAAVAALLVKKFIIPAKDELCAAWGEAIKAQG